jgi:hypothetical protein
MEYFKMKKVLIIVALMASVAFTTACVPQNSSPKTAKATQAQKAKEAANSISFTENAEIDNIKARLELTSNPGLTGFVLLMNEAGQPIMYTGVKGKITSGGKRLTNPQRQVKGSGGGYTKSDVMVAPSDEGTWGSSNPYVYFWTTSGQYVQWNGKYLYSDKPFRTSVEPLVIAIK